MLLLLLLLLSRFSRVWLLRPHRRQPTRLPHPWDSLGKNTGVGCHFLLQCMKVKSQSEVAQSCPTLRDPMDCSPPGSSVHGIFQARVLEWGAMAFSERSASDAFFRWSYWVRFRQLKWFAQDQTIALQAPLSMEFSRQEYRVGGHSLPQEIFPTRGLNSGLLHCRTMWATREAHWWICGDLKLRSPWLQSSFS